jgi:hypothetical protein
MVLTSAVWLGCLQQKNIFWNGIKQVSLVSSADVNTFFPFWLSCMHKCIPFLDLRFLCSPLVSTSFFQLPFSCPPPCQLGWPASPCTCKWPLTSQPHGSILKVGTFLHVVQYQGCQMVCFQTKNPNLGKFWRVLQWKILVYFMTIWSILRPLKIFYGHLVHFLLIWYIFPILVSCTKNNLATLETIRMIAAGFVVIWYISPPFW